ncbi:hypothetical protein A5698_01825 [Mycobacterium sp. E136]|uniref:nuclear transport factor 2 family protein n=1 Tax=Mycobacterium sp. E136 TaxID=1834125 RepID=UPI0007FFA34B|nr:nuclear transport factor 2 family protein [Mycobacterium sp. E136]OBG94520.1 hypothetical protein A5698_01825 [Mycobacterium sp. E136]
MPIDQSALDVLVAKDAIRDLVLQYCRAIDRGDVASATSLYTDDALDEHGFNSTNTAREFLESLPAMTAALAATQHNLTNHLIRITGPDSAEGEAYLVAYHRAERRGTAHLLITGGRYLDRYRHDGRWKIAHRKCVADWTHEFSTPLTAHADNAVVGAIPEGRSDGDDPSYAFFGAFPRGQRF